MKSALFALLGAAAACSPAPVAERSRSLPIRSARPVSIGTETRPARLVFGGQRLAWSIPSSRGGTVDVGLASFSGDAASPTVEILAERSEGHGSPRLLARVSMDPKHAGWKTWRVPWEPHARPARLELDVVRRSDSSSAAPAATLVAEPVLIPPPASGTRPNVVIFLVDTLRADRLGCYGDRGAHSPEIDRLAREGLRVERAISSANWTLPAHVSLFTSTEVATHQVGGARPVLSDGLPTLAEVLRREGYRTVAVTNGGFLDPHFGLARGFQDYFSVDLARESIEASVRRALEMIGGPESTPFFLFFHTYEVHQYSAVPIDVPPAERRPFSPGELQARYDDGVGRSDSAFGFFRSELRRRGLAENTLIVFTSDHGEVLNDALPSETQRWGHGHPYLRDNENRIPLILFDPRRNPVGRVDAPVSLIDVAPTELAELGLPPEPGFQGKDFARPAVSPIARDRLLVTEEPHSQSLAVERDRRKLILRPDRASLQSGFEFFSYGPLDPISAYDLRDDPGETRDQDPGPREREFDGLVADASRTVGMRFPGAVVFRIPPGNGSIDLSIAFDSGIRGWHLFAGGEPARNRVVEEHGHLSASLSQDGGFAWFAVDPRREHDGFSGIVESRAPVVLSDGRRLSPGASRWSWSDLTAARLPGEDAIVISAEPWVADVAAPVRSAVPLPPSNVA
ncbi:MAG TPA: sulfatase, partial [Thermoanaerobaculia bacterium]|nr:sulfatase [Thermoanaerobaculia bacterium]